MHTLISRMKIVIHSDSPWANECKVCKDLSRTCDVCDQLGYEYKQPSGKSKRR